MVYVPVTHCAVMVMSWAGMTEGIWGLHPAKSYLGRTGFGGAVTTVPKSYTMSGMVLDPVLAKCIVYWLICHTA